MPVLINGPNIGRFKTGIMLAAAVVIAFLVGFVTITLAEEEQQARANARSSATALVNSLEQIIRNMATVLDDDLIELRLHMPRTHDDIVAWFAARRHLQGLAIQASIVDRKGDKIANTIAPDDVAINFADREAFYAPRDSGADRLFISRTVVGRVSGQWSLLLSRPILDAAGAFDGIVALSVDAHALIEFCRLAMTGPQGVVGIAGMDGHLRVRLAGQAVTFDQDVTMTPAFKMISESLPEGSFWSHRSPVDGVNRTIAFKRVGDTSLFVVVGVADQDVMAPVAQKTAEAFIVVLTVSGFILFLTALINFKLTRVARSYELERQLDGLQMVASVFDNALESIIVTDPKGVILRVNPAFTAITGFEAEEAVGKTPGILRSDHQGPDFYETMWSQLVKMGSWQGEIWNRQKDGNVQLGWLTISAIKDSIGRVVRYVGIFADISQVHASRQKIQHQANHDALTGLPNRALLLDRLEHAIHGADRKTSAIAVMFIDLDRFKGVNDTLGHEIGDTLLKSVSERIMDVVRECDTVARLGGDEFIVLLTDITDPASVAQVAEKITATLQSPFFLAANEIHIGASIGISIFPTDGSDPRTLMKQADMAMYAVKQSGRNSHRFFSEEMNDAEAERHALENSFRGALERNELVVHYQPKITLRDNRVIGMEALVRWNHPVRGLLPPDAFLPLAEKIGLSVTLGEWVLSAVCTQVAVWTGAGYPVGPISVNISWQHLLAPHFVDRLTTMLADHGIAATAIELEFVEASLMREPDRVTRIFARLSEMGIGLHVDDFGTGQTKLAYLSRLPIKALKIDGSFVQDMVSAEGSAVLISSAIQLATAFGLDVVAEGVETEGQAALLKAMGCSTAQGFLYSTALPADEIATHVLGGACC